MLNVSGERAAATGSKELAARIAEGDPSAEQLFVKRYERGVRALVRRHCRPNDPDVSDLVQDVLAAVLQRLREGAIRDAEALSAYLQVSVVRQTAAEYRKRAQRNTTNAADVLALIPDEGDVVADLDRARRDRAVRDLIDQLNTERDRELLRRFYIEERTKDEVCAALGIEPAHFHRVVFRARQRLRELLEGAGIRSSSGETESPLETPA